jgi:HSP20 family protein
MALASVLQIAEVICVNTTCVQRTYSFRGNEGGHEMSTMTRWNPFRAATRYDPLATFDDLFRGFGARPLREFEATPDIRIDVSEDPKVYRVKAEMPGIDKKDIEISVEGNQVSIGAEVKRETKGKDDEKDVYTERYFGKVFRAFTLPNDLDSAKADAQYDKGVLILTLPKKGNGGSRRIAIS